MRSAIKVALPTRVTGTLTKHPPEKSSASLLVATGLNQNIDNAAVLVNRAPQILKATTGFDEGLVQVPSVAQFPTRSA